MISTFFNVVDAFLTLDEGCVRTDLISGDSVTIDGNLNRDVAGRISGSAGLVTTYNVMSKMKKFYIIVGRHKIEVCADMDVFPKPLTLLSSHQQTIRLTFEERHCELKFTNVKAFERWLTVLGESIAELLCAQAMNARDAPNNTAACQSLHSCIHQCSLLTSPTKSFFRRVNQLYEARSKLADVMQTLRFNPCDVSIKDIRSLKEAYRKFPELQGDPELRFLVEKLTASKVDEGDLQVIMKDIMFATDETSTAVCVEALPTSTSSSGSSGDHGMAHSSSGRVSATMLSNGYSTLASAVVVGDGQGQTPPISSAMVVPSFSTQPTPLIGPATEAVACTSHIDFSAPVPGLHSTSTEAAQEPPRRPARRKMKVMINGAEVATTSPTMNSVTGHLGRQVKVRSSKFTTPTRALRELKVKTKTPPDRSILEGVRFNTSPVSLPVEKPALQPELQTVMTASAAIAIEAGSCIPVPVKPSELEESGGQGGVVSAGAAMKSSSSEAVPYALEQSTEQVLGASPAAAASTSPPDQTVVVDGAPAVAMPRLVSAVHEPLSAEEFCLGSTAPAATSSLETNTVISLKEPMKQHFADAALYDQSGLSVQHVASGPSLFPSSSTTKSADAFREVQLLPSADLSSAQGQKALFGQQSGVKSLSVEDLIQSQGKENRVNHVAAALSAMPVMPLVSAVSTSVPCDVKLLTATLSPMRVRPESTTRAAAHVSPVRTALSPIRPSTGAPPNSALSVTPRRVSSSKPNRGGPVIFKRPAGAAPAPTPNGHVSIPPPVAVVPQRLEVESSVSSMEHPAPAPLQTSVPNLVPKSATSLAVQYVTSTASVTVSKPVVAPIPAPAVKFSASAMLHAEEMASTARSGLQRRGKKSLSDGTVPATPTVAENQPSTAAPQVAPVVHHASASASAGSPVPVKKTWMVAVMIMMLLAAAFLSGSVLYGNPTRISAPAVTPMRSPSAPTDSALPLISNQPWMEDALAPRRSGNFEMRVEIRPPSAADQRASRAGSGSRTEAESYTSARGLQSRRTSHPRAVQAHMGTLRRLLTLPLKMVENLLGRVLAGLSYYRRLFD
jgi:hypothetical protein